MQPHWARGDLLPHSPKFQHYWNLIIRLFSVISRTLIGGYSLQICSQCILQPQPTGQLFIVKTADNLLSNYVIIYCLLHDTWREVGCCRVTFFSLKCCERQENHDYSIQYCILATVFSYADCKSMNDIFPLVCVCVCENSIYWLHCYHQF